MYPDDEKELEIEEVETGDDGRREVRDSADIFSIVGEKEGK